MRFLIAIFFCLNFIVSSAQVKFGMSQVYYISPSSATDSTVGIVYDSLLTINCSIKNTGNLPYTGSISYIARVDTGSSQIGMITYWSSVAANNLMPGDSVSFAFVDTIKPNTYKKVGGNGNTIVVWPYVSGIETTDTLITVPVYVPDIATSIKETGLEFLQIYPNPFKDKLYIKPATGIVFEKLIIYDVQMKKIREERFSNEIDIGELPQGSYWINTTTKDNKIYSALIIKNQ